MAGTRNVTPETLVDRTSVRAVLCPVCYTRGHLLIAPHVRMTLLASECECSCHAHPNPGRARNEPKEPPMHTPGPWNPEHWDDEVAVKVTGSLSVTQDEGDVIAWIEDGPNADANARLIAAAPQMLAFIKRFLESTDYDADEREARAILRAVEG
jgi:hypothetical protein